jgi:hypothetical protein
MMDQIQKTVDSFKAPLENTMAERQGQVDSPQEYARISKICNDQRAQVQQNGGLTIQQQVDQQHMQTQNQQTGQILQQPPQTAAQPQLPPQTTAPSPYVQQPVHVQ